MVMENIESDTDQVFYKGKNYRKVRAGLSRPHREKTQDHNREKKNVSEFQDMLH